MRRRFSSRASLLLFLSYIFLSCFPEYIETATVTLESIEILRTHEWLPVEPQVYFSCKGENKTFLPDVKKKNVVYAFRGQESWQPLTEFSNNKCKRCGLYEKDSLKSDDVFGEWEFCPDDFTVPNGQYGYSVEKEFNATFSCPDCVAMKADIENSSGSVEKNDKHHDGGRRMHWTVVVFISALASSVIIVGMVAAYKFWQKKRREHEQARFLRLFEEDDDIEDELGIGPFGGSV
ncbi:hypothetical protein ACET3Z_009434 [Daucus carota]